MSLLAIRADGLGKRYHLRQSERYYTLRDVMARIAGTPWRYWSDWRSGKPKDYSPAPATVEGGTIWALNDVCFEIGKGEIVGVIGGNGAGKSTLLRVLSRITKPTTGYAEVHGRVGSLLEVGTGFHPELSGRENVYLNGAILGMRRAEIVRKFDEIVAFAEVEKFVDTQVKYYSSGMYMRLAFAVAAHLEPEILLVDEVLAVGDAAFQKKCLGKMGTVAKEGRTILLVSHNMTAVQSLCQRGLWLDEGQIVRSGPISTVISAYLQTTATTFSEQLWATLDTAPGNEKVRLQRVRVCLGNDERPEQITVQTSFMIEIDYWNLKPEARLSLSLMLYNQEGLCVFASPSVSDRSWFGRPLPAGLFHSTCRIPGELLNTGIYRAVLLVVQDAAHIVYTHDEAVVFEVADSAEGRGDWYGEWIGAVRPRLDWTTQFVCPLENNGGLTV